MNHSKIGAGTLVPVSSGERGPDRTPLEVSSSTASTLGINTRFSTPPSSRVEIPRLSPKHYRFAVQSGAREVLPMERVAWCMREVIPTAGSVDVFYSPKHKSSSLGGVAVCGSVWHCPVCSAKISERRRVELEAAIAAHKGQVFLATFTVQHSDEDALEDLLDDLLKASHKLRAGKAWTLFKERYGVLGSIRALEVTYGLHGFHPHLHVLFFVGEDANVDRFTGDLLHRWREVVGKVGRYASPYYGLDVRSARADVAAYVSKWGKEPRWTVAHEMTKSQVKRAVASGVSMLQLLEMYSFCGDDRAGALWREYAMTFKGKKQLVWSRGLRQALGLIVEEKTDEELAKEIEEDAVLLARLTRYEWRFVVANDARGELMDLAATGDAAAVLDFVARLVMFSARGSP